MKDVLKYKDYIATVQYSGEDRLFTGKIMGIEELITFHGLSLKELQKAFKEAVIDYLETCIELGKEPEKSVVV